MKTEESLKQTRNQIYSCTFCRFVQETMGVENLDQIDERKYLFHLSSAHGLQA
jgi:hypothetical protein